MDAIIKDLPSDKALGSDASVASSSKKKSWSMIKHDIYHLCRDFFNHTTDLKSINYSYITLVPKKPNPKRVSDFRPISLLNPTTKFITKILSDCRKVILQVLHRNQ